jgi:hypothetical protein
MFVGFLSGLTAAHMEMSWPYPLRSKFDPENNYTNIDYSMTNPLLTDGTLPLCLSIKANSDAEVYRFQFPL